MRVLNYLAGVLLTGSAFFPSLTASQPPGRPPDLMVTLNREAEATDPAGIHDYSQHLIQLLVVAKSAGPAYAASLADRLARAELMGRQGRRKLISEADIAQAFNALMRETGAPHTLTANIDAVHSNRVAFEGALPSVISQKANGSLCNPGEAVWVVSMLIANVGRPAAPSTELDHNPHVGAGAPPVQRHLELFSARHSRSEVAEVFDHLFNHLQI